MARELARIVLQICEEIQRTLPLLRNKEDRERILQSAVEVNRLENVADDIHRRGLSGARNTAIEHTTEDIVVFLDDDASASPTW